ncbi:MAG: 6-hydroxymethylpterin diphosphokinase MptE-like protein [Salinirussus sp.]
MDFATWEPVYEIIREDMGYDRDADTRARDRLLAILGNGPTADVSAKAFSTQTVAIVAPGRTLEDDLDSVEEADEVIAAGRAADRLIRAGIEPHWVVTDLDGHPDHVPALTERGPTVLIHAHGDNIELLERVVPDCNSGAVIPTTQVAPAGPVRNYGGFTDGDRAAFFADAFGANRLTFPGWQLDDADVGGIKRQKLDWAARLLAWLERRRGEQFSVLDDLRAVIDLSVIPDSS